MANTALLREELRQGKYDDRLRRVYVSDEEIKAQYDRYCSLADDFDEIFSADREVRMFSAPGRTEVGGNHTDHNHGRVLAAGINLDAIALASKNDDNTVRVKSKGYAMDVVELSDLSVHDSETGHSPALVRGVMKGFLNYGYKVGGFDAVTASRVLSGSGLSSSAAFEVLIGTVINCIYNDGKAGAEEIAHIGQNAENLYFGMFVVITNGPDGFTNQSTAPGSDWSPKALGLHEHVVY